MVKGQFYFFDPDLLRQIGAVDQDLISNNGGSIFFWKTASKALVINDWTVIPDDRDMPLGLVKAVKYVYIEVRFGKEFINTKQKLTRILNNNDLNIINQ